MNSKRRYIELLAPAKNETIGIEAIKHGADAVYIGASAYGARAQAGNNIDAIKSLVDFAHQFDARIYTTVNTIVYDNELIEVEKLINELYHAGVDAIIVQDLGILRLDLPPIALHASTQCDIRTPEKAQFLERMGFSQLVLARELTIDDIKAVNKVVSVPLEGFCHGALCVSYSGRCQISQALKGRSANRGECAQFCRLSYDLEDARGNAIMKSEHLLSLRDFNASDRLKQMIDAGVSSFKIEGRLKDVDYVKNVVAYYRKALDRILATDENLQRSSTGTSTYTFTPSLEKSFNRSFTHYFLDGRNPANGVKMASLNTPKSQGEYLGKVTKVNGKVIAIDTRAEIVNGDGLSYIDPDGNYDGMRVNKVAGNNIIMKEPCNITRGDRVYRTHDKAFNDILAKPSATRTVSIDFKLWCAGKLLCLKACDERGCMATHSIMLNDKPQAAKQSQHERQRQVLAKLGDTIFTLRHCEIEGDFFIPVSQLAQLRRETIEMLERSHRIVYERDERKEEDTTAKYPQDHLVSADNVANHLASQLYKEHGIKDFEPAIECTSRPIGTEQVLMNTRYCLRRELGACLKDKRRSRELPLPLFLRNGKTLLRVDCDCSRCEMLISLASRG